MIILLFIALACLADSSSSDINYAASSRSRNGLTPTEIDQIAAYIANLTCVDSPRCSADATDITLSYTHFTTPAPTMVPLNDTNETTPFPPPPFRYGSDDFFPTDWIYEMCPEVVQFYERVPYFQHFDKQHKVVALTTQAAMSFTCLLRLIDIGCRRANATWVLYAGGSIGGALHAGPIPWDDDVDIIVELAKKDIFLETMNNLTAGRHRLSCIQGFNAVKCFIPGLHVKTFRRWEWPFVDVFFFDPDYEHNNMTENARRHLLYRHVGVLSEYFPVRNYMYGGLWLPGPDIRAVTSRYKIDRCFTPSWYHRRESVTRRTELCCCQLQERFPFVHRIPSSVEVDTTLEITLIGGQPVYLTRIHDATREVRAMGALSQSTNGLSFTPHRMYVEENTQYQLVLRDEAFDTSFADDTWYTSPAQRHEWYKNSANIDGTLYTKQIPNLSQVEIVNLIAPPLVARSDGVLRVVSFNAQRGKSWFLFAAKIRSDPILRHADIIILNEMDLGMARSRNEHTTRLLAHALQMNYAYGVEFVELTNGDRDEQKATIGMNNFLGLHGNAILSKYPLSDPYIIRDPLENSYYSSKKTWINAQGYEKRLGGRMALFVSVQLSTNAFVSVGSMHKISKAQYQGIADKLRHQRSEKGFSGAVIAGDQAMGTCRSVGMVNVDNSTHKTFPASCISGGRLHGDIICSTMKMYNQTVNILPCYNTSYTLHQLSDHTIQAVDLVYSK